MIEPSPPPERRSQVADLIPLVRSVVGARISDPAISEDLVQETLARLVVVERRLDPSALGPYAVVTARNVVRGKARADERELRHRPRMLDPRQPEDPAARALENEDRRALAVALERLPGPERESLGAHDAAHERDQVSNLAPTVRGRAGLGHGGLVLRVVTPARLPTGTAAPRVMVSRLARCSR